MHINYSALRNHHLLKQHELPLPCIPPVSLQVLTTVTSDARDIVEIRRSEAALKAKLQEAEAKLKVRRVKRADVVGGDAHVETLDCSESIVIACTPCA